MHLPLIICLIQYPIPVWPMWSPGICVECWLGKIGCASHSGIASGASEQGIKWNAMCPPGPQDLGFILFGDWLEDQLLQELWCFLSTMFRRRRSRNRTRCPLACTYLLQVSRVLRLVHSDCVARSSRIPPVQLYFSRIRETPWTTSFTNTRCLCRMLADRRAHYRSNWGVAEYPEVITQS